MIKRDLSRCRHNVKDYLFEYIPVTLDLELMDNYVEIIFAINFKYRFQKELQFRVLHNTIMDRMHLMINGI